MLACMVDEIEWAVHIRPEKEKRKKKAIDWAIYMIAQVMHRVLWTLERNTIEESVKALN